MDKILSEKYKNCVNDLEDFESVYNVGNSDDNIHALEATRVELNSLWDQLKRSYTDCRDRIPEEGEIKIDKNKLRTHYKEALDTYKRVLSSLNEKIQKMTDRQMEEKLARESEIQTKRNEADTPTFLRLPPCDTDTFRGGYQAWPSFRDLFTTLYIENKKLSNVEKLFHLTQKTAGEPREIISQVPLTHDGFDIAWKNLVDRYENKRMQVNEQLKSLFNLPIVSVDSGASIQKLQRTIKSCTQTLEALKVDTKGWDPILTYLCSTKLPRPFLEEFENSLKDCTVIPSWKEFDTFLTHKFKTLESVGNIKPSSSKYNQPRPDYSKKEKRVSTFQTNVSQKPHPTMGQNNQNTQKYSGPRSKKEQNCQLCRQNHLLRVCPKFLEKSVNDRIHLVKLSHLCYNCLLSNHGVKDCKSRYSCRECRQRHNTLLHKGNENRSSTHEPVRDNSQPSTSAAALNTIIQSTSQIESPNITTLTLQQRKPPKVQTQATLLFTAIVQIQHGGQRYDARAIIDSGSQSTFITEKLRNMLRLPTKKNLVQVSGINQNISETSTKSCFFHLCSRVDTSFELEVWAPILRTLPSNLPLRTLDETELKFAAELELADPKFYASRPVDLLIGMDIGPLIYTMGVPMKSIGTLLAQKTVFGWIVGGPINQKTRNANNISLHNTTSIEKVITRFWEVEETPKKILRSEEDTFCEENFKATTIRDSSGRYIVTLPFKNCEGLGSSRNIALAQFYRMERKLLKTPDIKEQYDSAILEYLDLGHMRKISNMEIDTSPNYYLPHHAVIKPDRVTTKLRVVFNASSPTSNKRSLNDNLYPGPILQQDLVIQILKWRFFKYVYNADVTKMYRQIFVDPTQTKFQRILFRKSPNDPVEDFELMTVTFGINCAPFLAIRTLLQLAEDVKVTYPLASQIIQQNLYVDDVLAGGHTVEQAIASRKQLATALASAGFELRKWCSNDPKIIHQIPSDLLLPVNWLDLSEDSSTKTLGIRWSISTDAFGFTSPLIEKNLSPTKREVLSTIAKFFDPCGWLAPIIIVAKLIMQQVWLDKVEWDEVLKTPTQMSWQHFVKNCPSIDYITVPRWVQFNPSSTVEIHGFCDASEKAYAAALYIRIENDHTTDTFLLAAKTRVAPIKQISLPRLELCGAVLLSTLAASILPKLQISNFSTQYWTDSTIVLAWLKKPPCSWSTFVGNRVSEILDNVGNENWRHIDSECNPADIASRGCSPEELKSTQLWWHGPQWLKMPKDRWPIHEIHEDTNLEAKAIKVFATTTLEDPLLRFSSLSRAYEVLAYSLRYWKNTGIRKSQFHFDSTTVTTEEIQDVKARLIIFTQKQHFGPEYKALKLKNQISRSSGLISLNPFLDTKGIVRANGRLAQSPALTYNERHPIILPYESRYTQLLVESIHKITAHGGNQLMTQVVRSEFWIFRLKPLVKKVIRNCKTCLLQKKETQSQIMAALPPERTTLTRPFTNTGVDFAGPFSIKNFTGRACLITKGYVCVFVCFATKAIHLEATSDLSTLSFLAAFNRFMGRRGCPARIYSDNGTNFVGAAEMIKKDRIQFMKTLQTNTIKNSIHQDLEWKFIPPGAPHMGGLWEAGVKSFKTHLRKLIPKMNFTFEEFSTILARIESCLNSRPLSPSSDDPSDLTPLTPGHFLIGTSMLTPAEPDISEENVTLANRWKRLRIISQHFCQRWKSEYLKELHRRNKWKCKQKNVQINDLVVIKDEKLAPNEWKMGRIVKTYPGPDQNIRVIDIRTSNGILTRPITKIVHLLSD